MCLKVNFDKLKMIITYLKITSKIPKNNKNKESKSKTKKKNPPQN